MQSNKFIMTNKKVESTRVVIIGTGLVGSTAAYTIMVQGIASEIVLIDLNKDKCLGEAMDLDHGLSFLPGEARVWAGDYSDCADADVVVICAGVGQKPGQTRLDLAKINTKIVADVVKNVSKYTKEAILLVVANPLDVLTYTALKISRFPKNQVFGTGTTLDSSRFRYLLAQKSGIAATSMGAYLIGEHGDSEVPVYSHVNIMGENIKSFPQISQQAMEEAFEKTKNAANEIIAKKGATYYAIAIAVSRIVRAILFDENHVFPVSSLLSGQYGIENVCLSLPSVVGRTGIKKVLDIKLSADEQSKLKKSAAIIRATLDDVGVK
jgi:L-lactate dehydrogenase